MHNLGKYTLNEKAEKKKLLLSQMNFFFTFKLRMGVPIFPPNNTLNLFFFNKCEIILQVVDFPFVPVITILFKFLLTK